jgi:hypothetical protein
MRMQNLVRDFWIAARTSRLLFTSRGVLYMSAWVHFNGRAESYLSARFSQHPTHTLATITPRAH